MFLLLVHCLFIKAMGMVAGAVGTVAGAMGTVAGAVGIVAILFP